MFPEVRGLEGPLTSAHQRRSLTALFVCWLLGLTLVLVAPDAGCKALGLGLFAPGTGFLYTGHPWLFLTTLIGFAASLALWLMMGVFLAPPLIWIGSAVLAAVITTEANVWDGAVWVVPLASIATMSWLLARRPGRLRTQLHHVKQLNRHLATVSITPPDVSYRIAPALTDEELGALRFTLDLALQPIDQWRGFTTIDQFREAAWRYQLYSMSWSLSLLRATRLPAFDGYLQLAQRNTIVKMTNRRVWSYWFLENLWGNLKINPDPMLHENIMLSGWYATVLGMYQITTGDRSFDAPGSLLFQWNHRRIFSYDYPSIVEAINRNFDHHKLCLFPCEPNWVFMYCNEQAMAGVTMFDRIHGTRHSHERMPRFRKMMLDELTTADGTGVMIYSNHTGFHIHSRPSMIPHITSSSLRNVFAPDLAARSWEQLRHQFLRRDGGDLLPLSRADQVDPGNYQFNGGCFALASMMQSAREMGDDEIYEYARMKYEALGVTPKDGALRWAGSTYSNLIANSGRFGSAGAWHRLGNVDYPKAWLAGPRLAATAAYPDVLVALAHTDGQALWLVLSPGTSGGGLYELQFSQLRPRSSYRLSGITEQTLHADENGRARAQIQLEGRRELTVSPLTA